MSAEKLRATADEIDAGDWYNVNPPTGEWSELMRRAAAEIESLQSTVHDLSNDLAWEQTTPS